MRRAISIATSMPVRVVVSAALLMIVAFSVDWHAVGEALANASWGLFALATVVYFCGFLIITVRWSRLLSVARVAVSFRQALRAYLIGMFANNLLPSGYGGDAVRAWVVGGAGKPLARSVISVLVDRLSALACLIALAWIAVVFKSDDVPVGLVLLLGLASGLAVIAGLAGLLVVRRSGLGRYLPDAVRPYTSEVAAVLRTYERDRSLIGTVFMLGFLYQATVLVAFWLIGEALSLNLDPAIFAIILPLVVFATLLPISLAGFGVREGTFVVLLDKFGVSAADATLLSLLAVTSIAIASLPGGLAIAFQDVRGGNVRLADMRRAT